MSNRPDTTPNPHSDPGKEALARARAARAVLREQQEQKERQNREKQQHRRLLLQNTLRRTCTVYTVLNLLYFLIYLVIIFPIKGQPFADMILGGTSIAGHAVFLAASALTAFVYSLVLYRRPQKEVHPIPAYFFKSCIWFTAVMWVCIAAHGIYLDMLYNPYDVTKSAIFLGPSFLLTFSTLLFSLGLTAVNRIYRAERMPIAIRAILHLVCVIVLLALCFQLIVHGFATAADLLIFLVIFSVLYAFVCIFCFAARSSIRREENDAEEYESMFQKTPKKASDSNPAE